MSFASLPLVDTVSNLPPCKRYITTHTPEGKSIIHSSPSQKYRGLESLGGVARSYTITSFPADLTGDKDVQAYLADDGPASYTGTSIVCDSGINVTLIDLAPLASSQFHRTLSLDVVTVTHGTIHLYLDGDPHSFTELHAGDHVVQRGTMHKWTNPSDTEPARFVAVVVPAKGFEIGDGKGGVKEVGEEHVEGSEVRGWDESKL